jgi:UDP-N-acetylmuramoyl-tripeptide--D-alanyl-D-alanine ligase
MSALLVAAVSLSSLVLASFGRRRGFGGFPSRSCEERLFDRTRNLCEIVGFADHLVDRVLAMRERSNARVRTFGRHDDADVRADDVRLDDKGRAGFRLSADGGTARVQLELYGEHQVTNALAAASVALEVGMSLEATAAGLSVAAPTSRWRMEVVETDDGVLLINDAYNANPDSMAAGLRALMTLAAGRRTWAVLGPMAELGDTGPDAHRTVGRLVQDLGVERVVVVGDAAAAIAETAVGPTNTVDVVADVAGAVALLTATVEPGDVVLVKASRSAGLERVAEALTAGTVPA